MSNCIVLDPFGGSGSTLIACEQTNRICYSIELDEKFADVIVNRYYQYFLEYKNFLPEIYVIRNGQRIKYEDIKKEIEN